LGLCVAVARSTAFRALGTVTRARGGCVDGPTPVDEVVGATGGWVAVG